MDIKFEFHLSWRGSKQKQIATQHTETSFFTLADTIVENTLRQNRFSTAANYKTALRSFRQFMDGQEIALEKLEASHITGFERWLKEKEVIPNTSSCYMRSLRALYGKMGGRRKELFEDVFTGHARTVKRSVLAEDIRRLQQLPLRQGTHMQLCRDIFLFSFYCQGMPFVDIAFLQWKNIDRQCIRYQRHKTGQDIFIALEPCICDIIQRYAQAGSTYVFPILHTTQSAVAHEEYLTALASYNRTLKRLARHAGISQNLTSYVSRHTWASIAYNENVELHIISKAMGHTDSRTTLLYIKELDNQHQTNANRKVIDKVLTNKEEKDFNKPLTD